MITQTIDPLYFDQKTEQIRAQVTTVLTKWGLLPRFKRWRLTRDPGTGMVVLFGILNNTYIATHTSIPFSDYFDPRLLHDLANELQVQVVSCNSDGLRYAFILERGQVGLLPTHIDYPFLDGDRLFVRVVYADEPGPESKKSQTMPASTGLVDNVDDQILVNQGVAAFLKIFDDIKLKEAAASKLSAQGLPDVVVIDRDEFNKRVAEHKASLKKNNRTRRLWRLFDKSVQ
ncbi:MAG: hypothetical protein WCE68_03975 [Anaerolineales bacterium]